MTNNSKLFDSILRLQEATASNVIRSCLNTINDNSYDIIHCKDTYNREKIEKCVDFLKRQLSPNYIGNITDDGTISAYIKKGCSPINAVLVAIATKVPFKEQLCNFYEIFGQQISPDIDAGQIRKFL